MAKKKVEDAEVTFTVTLEVSVPGGDLGNTISSFVEISANYENAVVKIDDKTVEEHE